MLVDYRVPSAVRTGMRWTRGAGGSAAVAVVALGVWGASVVWVSICDGPEPIRPLIDDPLGQLRVFTARCCGRSTDRAPPTLGRCGGTAGLGQPGLQPGFDALPQCLGEHSQFGVQLINRLP